MKKFMHRIFICLIPLFFLPLLYFFADYKVYGKFTQPMDRTYFIIICSIIVAVLILFKLSIFASVFSLGIIIGTLRMNYIHWTFTITHKANFSGGWIFVGWIVLAFFIGLILQILICAKCYSLQINNNIFKSNKDISNDDED